MHVQESDRLHTGQSGTSFYDNNPLDIVTSDLGANVSLAAKEKIWCNTFVDIAKLLHATHQQIINSNWRLRMGKYKSNPNLKIQKLEILQMPSFDFCCNKVLKKSQIMLKHFFST